MPSPNYNYDKRRLETFIDAIIAIILTILVLELRVPETEHSKGLTTQQQVASLLPSFIRRYLDRSSCSFFESPKTYKTIHFAEHVFYPDAFSCTIHYCFCRK